MDEQAYICEFCGFNVLEDARGYVFSFGRVRRCMPPGEDVYCDELHLKQRAEFKPVLTNAEESKEC